MVAQFTTGTSSDEGLATWLTGLAGAASATPTANATVTPTANWQRFAVHRHHCRHRHRGRGQLLLHPGGDGRDQRLLRDHRGSAQQGTVATNFEWIPLGVEGRQGAALLLAVGRRRRLDHRLAVHVRRAVRDRGGVQGTDARPVPCSADHRVHVRDAEAAGGRHRYALTPAPPQPRPTASRGYNVSITATVASGDTAGFAGTLMSGNSTGGGFITATADVEPRWATPSSRLVVHPFPPPIPLFRGVVVRCRGKRVSRLVLHWRLVTGGVATVASAPRGYAHTAPETTPASSLTRDDSGSRAPTGRRRRRRSPAGKTLCASTPRGLRYSQQHPGQSGRHGLHDYRRLRDRVEPGTALGSVPVDFQVSLVGDIMSGTPAWGVEGTHDERAWPVSAGRDAVPAADRHGDDAADEHSVATGWLPDEPRARYAADRQRDRHRAN